MDRRWIVLAVFAVSLGCATGSGTASGDGERPAAIPLQAGIWDVEAGQPLQLGEFVDELAAARYVVVGESHGQPWDHTVQHGIVEELVAEGGRDVAVGLEMIERRFQPDVDAYLAGEIDEEEMLRRIEWHDRWGVDEMFYASHWRLARDRDLAIVALNARRELVSQVGDVGIDGLDDQWRAELPEIEKDDDYREHLRDIFAAHPGDADEDFEQFFEAQLVWDETMAETAREFMERREESSQMIMLVGRGHMERGYGIPPRLVRRGADRREIATVVPVSTDDDEPVAGDNYIDLEYLRDHQVADYVWIEP